MCLSPALFAGPLQVEAAARPVWKRFVYPTNTVYEGYMVNNKREVSA